jgi:hypothetical protein
MSLRTFIFTIVGAFSLGSSSFGFDYDKDVILYEGAAGTTKVKITASERPFSKTAHNTTELRNAGTEEKQDWRSATVDGKDVVGTDQTLPADGLPQLSALTVWFSEKKVSVPVEFLHHVFLPHLRPAVFTGDYADTLVAISADGKSLFLSLGVGDGGGASTYDLQIRADGTVSTKSLNRLEP